MITFINDVLKLYDYLRIVNTLYKKITINQRGIEMKIIKNKEINHRPKVSVLISTYNKEKFIGTTLDSVLK